jgi:fructokinase
MMTPAAVCIGEALIDFVAQTKSADLGASELFRRSAGGAVANVAVGVARLGGSASFCGTLGRDAFGRFLLRTLKAERVDTSGVRLVDALTTLAFVARGDKGARDFAFVRQPGADSCYSEADVAVLAFTRDSVLHFGGVLLSSEPARSACLAAARVARKRGALVTFDPNARPTLFASTHEMRDALRAGCASADLVKLSDEDLLALGVGDADAARLLGGNTAAVIVSRGARGCDYVTADGGVGQVAAPAVDALDTTGAGDAMMAAIIWRLASAYEGRISRTSIADAARVGCAAGAAACLIEGAIPSLPTPERLEAMLSRVP